MLRRAFSNLLSNAIKYSPDNTCTAIHLERDSDCVERDDYEYDVRPGSR